jgi:hypothetical protein
MSKRLINIVFPFRFFFAMTKNAIFADVGALPFALQNMRHLRLDTPVHFVRKVACHRSESDVGLVSKTKGWVQG